MSSGFSGRFKPSWFILLLTLPGDLLAGFFLVGGPGLDSIQWWRFGYLGAVYAALFLVGKLYTSYRGEAPSAARAVCVAAMHGLGVVAGASFRPASIRIEGIPFPLHPVQVYLGAQAVFLYASAFGVAVCRGRSEGGETIGKVHSLPFLALVAGLAPVVVACMPFDGAKASPFIALSLFAFAIPTLHALMLWRVYPRYLGCGGLESRHLRNLMRIQAALVMATAAGGAGVSHALVAGLGVYVLSSVFNFLYKPYEEPIPPSPAESSAGSGDDVSDAC